MKYVKLFVLLMIVFCSFCRAQNKTELSTGEVITSHGPNNITRNITQDRNGNIWDASWEGIFRYDGKSFTHITNKIGRASCREGKQKEEAQGGQMSRLEKEET